MGGFPALLLAAGVACGQRSASAGAPTPSGGSVEIGVLTDAIGWTTWPEVRAKLGSAGSALSCDAAAWHPLARGAAWADCGPVGVTVGGLAAELSVHLNRDGAGSVTVTHLALAPGPGVAVAEWVPAVHAALAATADEVVPTNSGSGGAATEFRYGLTRRALLFVEAGKPPVVQILRRGAMR